MKITNMNLYSIEGYNIEYSNRDSGTVEVVLFFTHNQIYYVRLSNLSFCISNTMEIVSIVINREKYKNNIYACIYL
jgi:hypothetical protein